MELKVYICKHCRNIVIKVKDRGVPVMCCGEKMTELKANTTDAAQEKHVPVYKVDGSTVTVSVGSTAHPMLEEHYIEWVALATKTGFSVKYLTPGSAPTASFALAEGEEVLTVYAYCNLHGLWKS
ncbi:MAG: desulfoferrodoxin [Clostridia bacterium]|nr:desulfoferrodoxin [Clostridia bacterium]